MSPHLPVWVPVAWPRSFVIHRMVLIGSLLTTHSPPGVESAESVPRRITQPEAERFVSVFWSEPLQTVDVTWVQTSAWGQETADSLRPQIVKLYRKLLGKGLDVPPGDERAFQAAVDREIARQLEMQSHPKSYRQRIRCRRGPFLYRVDQVRLQPGVTLTPAGVTYEESFVLRGTFGEAGFESFRYDWIQGIATRTDRKGGMIQREPVWQLGRLSPELRMYCRMLIANAKGAMDVRPSPTRLSALIDGTDPYLRIEAKDISADGSSPALLEFRILQNVVLDPPTVLRLVVDGEDFEQLHEVAATEGVGAAPSVSVQYSDFNSEGFAEYMQVNRNGQPSIEYSVESLEYNGDVGDAAFEWNPNPTWSTVDYRPDKPAIMVDGRLQDSNRGEAALARPGANPWMKTIWFIIMINALLLICIGCAYYSHRITRTDRK